MNVKPFLHPFDCCIKLTIIYYSNLLLNKNYDFVFFRIRKRFLVKRLLEVVFGVNLVLALFQQWMIPSVTNSVDPFSQMDPIKITERLLKLSVSFDTS